MFLAVLKKKKDRVQSKAKASLMGRFATWLESTPDFPRDLNVWALR